MLVSTIRLYFLIFIATGGLTLTHIGLALADLSKPQVPTGAIFGRTEYLEKGSGVTLGPFLKAHDPLAVMVAVRTIPDRIGFTTTHRIRFDSIGTGEWTIRLVHGADTLISFTVANLTRENGELFYWTHEIPPAGVSIVVDGNPFGLKAELDRTQLFENRFVPRVIVCLSDDIARFRTCDTRVDIRSQAGSRIYEWGQAVVALRISRESPNYMNRDGLFGCTGFRIAKDLIATAAHCWDYYHDSGERVRMATAEFFSELRPLQGTDTGGSHRVQLALEPAYMSRARDLAILWMIDLAPVTLTLHLNASEVPVVGEPLLLIENGVIPESSIPEKRVTDRGCHRDSKPPAFYKSHPAFFPHTCDIEATASGAPIFDTKGLVVGIHVGGRGGSEIAVNTASRIDRIYKTMLKVSASTDLDESEKSKVKEILNKLSFVTGGKR